MELYCTVQGDIDTDIVVKQLQTLDSSINNEIANSDCVYLTNVSLVCILN